MLPTQQAAFHDHDYIVEVQDCLLFSLNELYIYAAAEMQLMMMMLLT